MTVRLSSLRKFFLGIALITVPLAASTPAGAWMMAYSETQRSASLGLEEVANDPGSPLHINDIATGTTVYQGWRTAVLPDGVKPFVASQRQGTPDAGFVRLVDQQELNLTDMDAAVAGHLLAARIDTRSRFDMPVMQDARWTRMRPKDGEGHVIPWETLRRVKSWMGGAGQVIAVAKADTVAAISEPGTLGLLLAGLLPLAWMRLARRRV